MGPITGRKGKDLWLEEAERLLTKAAFAMQTLIDTHDAHALFVPEDKRHEVGEALGVMRNAVKLIRELNEELYPF